MRECFVLKQKIKSILSIQMNYIDIYIVHNKAIDADSGFTWQSAQMTWNYVQEHQNFLKQLIK